MKEAARAWAFARVGRTDNSKATLLDEEFANQFKAMGAHVDHDLIEVDETEALTSVWPDNWKVLNAFLSIETQWNFAGGGMGPLIFIGLDYAGAKAALKGRSNSAWRRLISELQIMEKAALPVLNERDEE